VQLKLISAFVAWRKPRGPQYKEDGQKQLVPQEIVKNGPEGLDIGVSVLD